MMHHKHPHRPTVGEALADRYAECHRTPRLDSARMVLLIALIATALVPWVFTGASLMLQHLVIDIPVHPVCAGLCP